MKTLDKQTARGLTTRIGANKLYDELMAEKRAARAANLKKAMLFKSNKTAALKAKGLTARFAKLAKAGKTKTKNKLFNSERTK